VQAHEGVEHEDPWLEGAHRLGQATEVVSNIEPHDGCGDDVDRQCGEAFRSVSA
jgi:hypothetical protein